MEGGRGRKDRRDEKREGGGRGREEERERKGKGGEGEGGKEECEAKRS